MFSSVLQSSQTADHSTPPQPATATILPATLILDNDTTIHFCAGKMCPGLIGNWIIISNARKETKGLLQATQTQIMHGRIELYDFKTVPRQ